ncbi:hypothetical protein Mterra_01508 [Calidithermus terrae]|uniref:Ribbon-helix-helix protein CopG domain-containing protein n=1 Tax=Calidithermus terrae TaxID=1408545 RepID=A0A399ENH1_9DEIN|nr:DUF6364 family protein [Calidithermus terrae]RIH86157.1 hypothetical protein Mterra_01508 [Calidithermus terrae]
MKSRVTITLDPEVVRKAKAVARARRTNLSALVEDLLRQTAEHAAPPHPRFSRKWAGKLELRESDGRDQLLEALKQRYGLGSE